MPCSLGQDFDDTQCVVPGMRGAMQFIFKTPAVYGMENQFGGLSCSQIGLQVITMKMEFCIHITGDTELYVLALGNTNKRGAGLKAALFDF